ncbi:unnamed protein product, partial [marine sediment metagenome]
MSERFQAVQIEGRPHLKESDGMLWRVLCKCGHNEWHIACMWNHVEDEHCGPPTMETAQWFAKIKNRDYRVAEAKGET